MRIEKIAIKKLNASAYNPRKDLQPTDKEYINLIKSIEEFGFVEPIVWNEATSNVVGGHQRLKVLIEKGHKEIDVSVVNLTEEQEKALNLALNKVRGDWDYDKLAELLDDLSNTEIDVTLTGFNLEEIDLIIAGAGEIDIDGIFEDSEPKVKPPKLCPHCGEEL